eukprot:TRINITY_DN24641_c0_g1_i2.p1 TRINITY_DN24641_c0_g1~~TRINITY_DN24641_c0_g1_i2.p1  ORF type:complete len:408 (-),score=63.29 TRINITY_DN24641_c0_g1_i2:832-2055(-)
MSAQMARAFRRHCGNLHHHVFPGRWHEVLSPTSALACKGVQLLTRRSASSRVPAFSLATPDEHKASDELQLGEKSGTGSDSAWRVGKPPPEVPLHDSVTHIEDAADARLVLYRQKRRRRDKFDARKDAAMRKEVLREAKGQLLQKMKGEGQTCSESADAQLEHLPIELHYGWECLERLIYARRAGKTFQVHSVLATTIAPNGMLEKAAALVPEGRLYVIEPTVFKDEFQSKATGTSSGACTFLLGFPFERRIEEMQPPFVVLDDLISPRNVGQIMRTAAHLGIHSVIATEKTWQFLNGRAARSSMGWIYHMDFHRAANLAETLAVLRSQGVCMYAAENYHATEVVPHEPSGCAKWALIVGNEDTGLSKASKRLCDQRVRVPQRGGASLNVGHAAAISLYELGRNMQV